LGSHSERRSPRRPECGIQTISAEVTSAISLWILRVAQNDSASFTFQ
jgi:hypothetical protein